MEAEKVNFNGIEYEIEDFNDRAKNLYTELRELSPQLEESETAFKEAQTQYTSLSNTYQWLLGQLAKELGVINDQQIDDNTEASGS
mgnify:CR=1 FL=1|jgi:uncharacterized protein YukE|tara:strand:+ start:195 stop:452 length:258 start_codon:yes stop_codon:yes gene_type:complete